MPYIVTTKRRGYMGLGLVRSPRVVSRRAVATLEEADSLVREILVEHGERAGVAPPLPEGGATLSPLPDGTVIEVEQTTWAILGGILDCNENVRLGLIKRAEAGHRTAQQTILDAYNARRA
jgi:hypothetical protein